MKPIRYDSEGLTFGKILKDTGVKLYEEAKRLAEQGANEESMLFTRASVLMQDAAKLPHKEFLDSAESIAKGVLFGTAAIAEQKAKAFWSNLIKTSFEFAASLAGGVLDLTGLSAAKPTSKKKKS